MAHRGKHSNDDDNFNPKAQARLREAAADLAFLLERGYAERSALELVGNRYLLNSRQQMALMRLAVSASEVATRRAKELRPADLADQVLWVDGYNVLIGVEVALSRGFLFQAMDGCLRDIASIHGTYRKVEETIPALELIGNVLFNELNLAETRWYFDSPVSNSGRLKVLMYELAEQHGFRWQIELVPNPDKVLIEAQQHTASSDGLILNHVPHWFNLARYLVEQHIPEAEVIRLWE